MIKTLEFSFKLFISLRFNLEMKIFVHIIIFLLWQERKYLLHCNICRNAVKLVLQEHKGLQ